MPFLLEYFDTPEHPHVGAWLSMLDWALALGRPTSYRRIRVARETGGMMPMSTDRSETPFST